MPFLRPTLAELIATTATEIAASLPGADPLLRRSVLGALTRSLAAMQHLQLGYIDWLTREGVPFTAEGEFLRSWAALKGIRALPPTAAALSVIVSGNPGIPVTADREVTRADGAAYGLTGGTIQADGTVTLRADALVAGTAGNAAIGTELTMTAPIAGVSSTVLVAGSIAEGIEAESDDALRSRMLQRFSAPPQGGDLDDYVGWTRAIPGVTRAWARGGAGAVAVYFMMDIVRADTAGIPEGQPGSSRYETRDHPATGDALVIADALYPLRSAEALVYGVPPVPEPLDMVLREVPQDDGVRAAISTALAATIRREASPGGVLLQKDLSPGGVLRLAHIEAALSAVPGLDHFIIDTPDADVLVPWGSISTPGQISYL